MQIDVLNKRIAVLERERAALKRSVDQLMEIMDAAPDLSFLIDGDNRYVDYRAPNDFAPFIPAEQFIGKTIDEVLPPDTAPMLIAACNKARTSGEVESVNYSLPMPDGEHHYEARISPVFTDHLVVIVRDFTKIRNAQLRMKNLAKRLGVHVQSTPLGFIEWDREFRITQWNRAANRIFGYSRKEAVGRHPSEIILPAHVMGEINQVWEGLLSQKGVSRSVNENMTRDGQTILCEWHYTPLLDDAGMVVGVASFVQDVTERKKAQVAIRASERRYRGLFEQAPMGILVANRKTIIVDANPMAGQILGYDPDQLIGIHSRELVHPDDLLVRPVLHPEMEQFKNLPTTFERRYKRADDTYIPVEVNVSQLGSGFALVSFHDISNRKKTETERHEMMERLRQSQKMEAVGTLAGGIAHDFNNLLMAILGYSDMALETLHDGHRAKEYIEQVLNAGMRARDTVQQILAFSRRGDNERHPLQLHLIVKETLKLLRATIPTTIAIEQQIVCENDLVLADPNQIQQLLMNLCTNAYQAMRETGGLLRVSLTPEQRKMGDEEGTDCLRLTVSDTGTGMDPLVQKRIFEPYFTTKKVGEGSGLGLSAVHGIVSDCGGEIEVESEPGRGSDFHVFLPRHHRLEQQPIVSPDRIPTGSERVLVVDDEELVGSVVSRMLGGLGYSVKLVLDPAEALERFRNDPFAFDLLLSDQTMPGMTGEELAQQCLAVREGFPVIVYSEKNEFRNQPEELADSDDMSGNPRLLKKPLTRAQLAQRIREILDQ